MDLDEKFLGKVSGVQSLSSSVQSTPEKNGNSDDASRSPELLQEFLKSGSKKELLRSYSDKDKKHLASLKCKVTELARTGSKTMMKQESRKSSSTSNTRAPKKLQRKGENPMQLVPSAEQSQETGHPNSWICKNSACKAVLSLDDAFCKRCSCCICHLFDDNKDPSLWLVCTSDNDEMDSCGLSCHIECALQREKVGVLDLGQFMQLDGSYCCFSCGKVSGILGCWKKQLAIAKDARRVDVLCYRIYLSYRLLDGSSRFKELHDIVKEAKAKIETEVGPVNGISAQMARGIVSRLSVAGDVQKLCSLAIEKAENMLANIINAYERCREDSLPAACRFLFEEVTSSSVTIILLELSTALSNNIRGYKLWYCKTKGEKHAKDPASVFPRTQRRILISHLQPCTEYTFQIVSFTEAGDLGHSEAKCFTKSIEVFPRRHPISSMAVRGDKETTQSAGNKPSSDREGEATMTMNTSGFKVRDIGKIIHQTWAQGQYCFEGFCSAEAEKCCETGNVVKPDMKKDNLPSVSRELDLNVASVPDLNEELTPPFDSRDEDNGCTLDQAFEADDDAASHEIEKNGLARSHGSGDSQTWTNGPGRVPAVHSRAELARKRCENALEEMHDCDSTLVNGSPLSNGYGCLDENFEYCVKIIRWLEREGHVNQDFRLKFLTWFSLRSTEQECRVVNTFIRTLIDDPSSLAAQLVDSFSDIISSKRPRKEH